MAILFSGVFAAQPERAEAWWGVLDTSFDAPNWIQNVWSYVIKAKEWAKDNVSNPLAWYAAKMMIKNITDSLVNWINSGFEGNPVFVTDSGAYFSDLANQATGIFIHKLGAENLLCGNFKPQILLSLSYKKPAIQKFKCTLDDAIENWDAFSKDFKAGGWRGWIAVSTRPQNNPIGAYLMARDEEQAAISSKVSIGNKEAGWGQGFMSMKKCSVDVDFASVKGGYCEDQCSDLRDAENNDYGDYNLCVNNCNNDLEPSDFSSDEKCQLSGGSMQNTTPGKIIETRLSKSLGMDLESLGVADEVGEVIVAVINQVLFSEDGLAGVRGSTYSSVGGKPSADTKGSLVETISNNTSYERKYGDAKRKSSGLYAGAIEEINKLKNCYESQIEVLERMKAELEKELADARTSTVRKNKIEAKIEEIDARIADLNGKIAELEATISTLEAKKAALDKDAADSDAIVGRVGAVKQQILNAETYEDVQKYYNQVEAVHGAQAQINAEDESKAVEEEVNKLIYGTASSARAREMERIFGSGSSGTQKAGGIKGDQLQCSDDFDLLLEEEKDPLGEQSQSGNQNP